MIYVKNIMSTKVLMRYIEKYNRYMYKSINEIYVQCRKV